MKKTFLISSLIISFFIINTASAAVFIQTQNAHRDTTDIYIDRNKARIELPGREGFIVMDLDNRTMKAVLHAHRTIVDMSEFLQQNTYKPPAKYVDTYTKTMGLGPTIVGYETEEYALYANDQYCGSLYVSVAAMRDMGVTKFARVFIEMEKNMRAKLHALTGLATDTILSPCEESQRKANLKLRELGFPLKSINKNKHLNSVVTRVNKKAQLPANAFSIPSNYKLTDPSKMVNDAMQQMNPQMKEMIKHMTPEMRRMMQEQLQQYAR